MSREAYVVKFESEDRCELVKAYENRADAVQELQKEVKMRRHISWNKRSEDYYVSDDLEQSLRVVETELVTDEVEHRQQVRW